MSTLCIKMDSYLPNCPTPLIEVFNEEDTLMATLGLEKIGFNYLIKEYDSSIPGSIRAMVILRSGAYKASSVIEMMAVMECRNPDIRYLKAVSDQGIDIYTQDRFFGIRR